MSNNSTCFSSDNFSIAHGFEYNCKEQYFYNFLGTFASSIVIAILSPVAVVGNVLILAAIWKKTFRRTRFHLLLSGLAFTDLCTGLIAQPANVAAILLYTTNARVAMDRPTLYVTFETIADASAAYFIAVTILILTAMSVERWLFMSQRSLVTWLRGSLIATFFVLIPTPIALFRSLETIKPGIIGRGLYITIIAMILFCFVTTLVAYGAVFRIIRRHQQQVQDSSSSQNFGQPAINLAKYKKSVITILCILALFCACFLPYTVSVGIYVHMKFNSTIELALSFSLVLLFLSSSLSPCLYLWRMNDIRNGVKKLFCSNR